MEEKKSPEQGVRIKIGLIFFVVLLFFAGLSIYSYSLKKNIDAQKAEMDNSYKVLSKSNQLIISIQEAQEALNRYLISPRQKFQLQYDSISSDISQQISEIKGMRQEQDLRLEDIDSLLQEKNKMVRRLTRLFRSQNPLIELDQKIDRFDEIRQDTVVVTTKVDTIKVEKQKRGFWNRLKNVFDPGHAPDTTFNIRRVEQEEKSISRVDTTMYADLKNITEEASKTYSSRIEGIEREVRELLLAEQNISLRISQLTHEFYNEMFSIAWQGTENSEKLTQRIFAFAIVVGTFSILVILVIILYIIGDLNKGQRARAELVKEKQLTEELMESRHKLLLAVSHDVKTPLSSMMGYMEIWDSEEIDADKKRQLQSARSSGQHILNMLTNLLEFSRLQQKSAEPNYSSFDLIELTEDIIRMFMPFTNDKSITLTFDNQASAPLYVESDQTLLKQILSNVVSNAVKYTIEGGITIQLQDKGSIIFTITDSGIGMDTAELPEIFKPFSRMQSPLQVEGSGFGMYVTKGLVDLLEGNIDVTSEKGKGTRVTITLPLRKVEGSHISSETEPQPLPEGQRSLNILLFEDDWSLGNMIKEYLIRNGQRAELCNQTQEVDRYIENISQFDIVFTDMQMSEITGLDILRKIRDKEQNIPVWLMTAHDDYTNDRALSEGFSGLLRKPIQMSELLKIASMNQHNGNKSPIATHSSLQKKFPQLFLMFGDDIDTITEILYGFVQSSQQDMNLLEKLIENDDFEGAQRLCHKIHPFLGQLDAEHLCTTLRKMDMLRNEDQPEYPEWKEDLRKTITDIREFTDEIRKLIGQ